MFFATRSTRTLVALAMSLSAIAAPAAADPGKPVVCENIQAPAGSSLLFRAYAEGVQIYRWNGTTWSFVAPSAVLYANADGTGAIGIHYAGPTWQSVSGSKVVATVADRCPADPGSIPWLLLGAVTAEGPGIFDGVTHILRVNTVGGNAPATPGSFVGETVNVAYTADYMFYREN